MENHPEFFFLILNIATVFLFSIIRKKYVIYQLLIEQCFIKNIQKILKVLSRIAVGTLHQLKLARNTKGWEKFHQNIPWMGKIDT